MLWWQTLLGFRQISTKISKDYIGVTRLHIALGIYGSVFVFLHPFLQMIAYSETFSFIFIPNFATELGEHVGFGQFAFILFVLLWLTSAVLRNKINYRPWKYLHYLSYPIMLFVFFHAYEIGTFLNSFNLVRLYWFFIVSTYILLLVWKLVDMTGLLKARYVLRSKKEFSNDVFVYEFSPVGKKKLEDIKPGQFVYIKNRTLGESHPFSVMRFNPEGDLVFGIKKVGKYTESLSKISEGDTVFVDGPYGVFTAEGHNDDKKVVFAGGIGITPFVELVNRHDFGETIFFNANRNIESNKLVSDIKEKLGDRYIDVIAEGDMQEIEKNIVRGKMTKEIISAHVPQEYLKNGKYFICGPKGFMDFIVDTLKEMGVSRDRIFMEEFSL